MPAPFSSSSSPVPGFSRPQTLQNAQLNWQDKTPVAKAFADVYFSRDQGLAESHYVFLQQNDLPQRWAQWASKRAFVVGETGLGTGLNLLVAVTLFLQVAPPDARLHWVSTELYPLTSEDLAQAHQHWPELAEAAAWLQAVYPLPISGFHRLQLHPRITMDLLLGDAATNLAAWEGRVDAWCLDGFAPAKNPQMWTPALFKALAQLSFQGTTLATFTAAGFVRRGLQAEGFAVQKVPGFGRKREMLRGQFGGEAAAQEPEPLSPERIAVVGAGLSGLATAEALSRRGFAVDVYEATKPGAGGSGNRQGVLYIKLAVDATPASRFYLAGLEYSRRWLQRLDPEQQLWQDSGVLQLALTAKEADRQARFLARQPLPQALVHAVSQEEASALAGLTTGAGGLFYPRAGWVRPQALCQALATHLPGVRVLTATPITDLQLTETSWQLTDSRGCTQNYAQVVLAAATATQAFAPAHWLPVKAIRGQVSQTPAASDLPNTVVCGGGYVSPPWQGQLCFGASFNLHSQATEMDVEDHQSNWDEMQRSLPALAEALGWDQPLDKESLQGRVAFRCASPDYLPLVGAAPDFAASMAEQQLSYHSGLWLNLGQGSRGLASIPLAAELLASQICREPAPLEAELLQALQPGRFIRRRLKHAKS